MSAIKGFLLLEPRVIHHAKARGWRVLLQVSSLRFVFCIDAPERALSAARFLKNSAIAPRFAASRSV